MLRVNNIYYQRCEIFGDKALSDTNEHDNLQQYESGVLFPKLKHSYPQRYEESFALDIGAFVGVLLYGRDWPIKYNELVEDLKVIEVAKLSSQKNKKAREVLEGYVNELNVTLSVCMVDIICLMLTPYLH